MEKRDFNLGQTLRGHRNVASMTIESLGALTGLDSNTVGRHERDEAEPSL